MLRIRLRRVGAKKKPSYRIVVADARSPRDGAFVEVIGQYDPRANPQVLKVNEEKAVQWLKKGAQPSEPVTRLFNKLSLLERLKAK